MNLELPPKEAGHTYLLQLKENRDTYTHPADVVIELRDYIESLPETTSTFTLRQALKSSSISHHHVDDEMLYLIGSWKTPLTSQRRTRWVVPNSSSAARHTDVFTHCECGARMTRLHTPSQTTVHDTECDHTDDCTKPMRFRARAELCERRAEAIRQGLSHGHSGRSMTNRLSIQDSIGATASALGIDVAAIKQDFKTRRQNTLLHLLTQYDESTAGRVYDISGTRVREIIACETDYDVSDLK